jgi:hypothetical protein
MSIRSILAARAANKELERELSAYTSESDRNDLDAILDRHADEQADGIRRIVTAQRVDRARIPAQWRG